MDMDSIKQKVLQEIMDLMDDRSVDGLRKSAPKSEGLEGDSLREKLAGLAPAEGKPGDDDKMLMEDKLPMDGKKDAMVLELDGAPDEDDDMERLKELYSKLK